MSMRQTHIGISPFDVSTTVLWLFACLFRPDAPCAATCAMSSKTLSGSGQKAVLQYNSGPAKTTHNASKTFENCVPKEIGSQHIPKSRIVALGQVPGSENCVALHQLFGSKASP